MTVLNPNKRGIAIYCTVCRAQKAPRGRSVSPVMYMCNDDCKGYRMAPMPGSLFPGESEADFGFPVEDAGTGIVEAKIVNE